MDVVRTIVTPSPIDPTAAQALNVPPPQGRIGEVPDNGVSEHGATQAPPASGRPSDGARETTTNSAPGYAELERLLEERLMSDPEYRELKEKYDTWKQLLQDDFALIDQNTGVCPDQRIQLADLIALSNDKLANPEARAAAERLLKNTDIWNAIARGDNWVGVHDVTGFIAEMKAQLKEMKASVRAEVKGEQAAAAGSQSGQGAATAAGSEEPLFTRPPPSSKGGMEGAVENVGNTLTAIGEATSKLMLQLSDPKTSTELRQKLQAQYNDLQQLQQMLTAMYRQLQEAISSLMKMYSDVARNSIQNMR